jgi:hypothetical protein
MGAIALFYKTISRFLVDKIANTFEEIIDLIVAKKAIKDTCLTQLDWGISRWKLSYP